VSISGESPIMSEPEFIRAFQREYTAEEGESFSIECVLVGNPRPKIRLFFNENQIRLDEKNEFVQVFHSIYNCTVVMRSFRFHKSTIQFVSALRMQRSNTLDITNSSLRLGLHRVRHD